LDGSAQLPDLFVEGVTFLKESADVEAQSVFERDAISWRSGMGPAGECGGVHGVSLGLLWSIAGENETQAS